LDTNHGFNDQIKSQINYHVFVQELSYIIKLPTALHSLAFTSNKAKFLTWVTGKPNAPALRQPHGRPQAKPGRRISVLIAEIEF
jgi:hypothetical protein